MNDKNETNIIALLQNQIFELKEDIRKLEKKIDALLKLCYETHSEVKVLNEIKNTLRRDIDNLTKGSEILTSDKKEREGMIKVTKAIFTLKNGLIFFVGFIFAIAQHTHELEKEFVDSSKTTEKYVIND